MLFALICTDKPGQPRSAARHPAAASGLSRDLSRASSSRPAPLLDAEDQPCGSLLIIDVADRAEAAGFAEGDPYAKAGLFESTVIRPFRPVFKDGEMLG